MMEYILQEMTETTDTNTQELKRMTKEWKIEREKQMKELKERVKKAFIAMQLKEQVKKHFQPCMTMSFTMRGTNTHR